MKPLTRLTLMVTHTWWGVCVAGGGVCMAGGHAWQEVCTAGVCIAGARVGGMQGRGRGWQERRPLQRAVRILLECILVDIVYFDPK